MEVCRAPGVYYFKNVAFDETPGVGICISH